jgi:hypothetical protein
MQVLVLVVYPQFGRKSSKKPKPANTVLFLNKGVEFRRERSGREWDAAKPTTETFDSDLEKSQTSVGAFAIFSDNLEDFLAPLLTRGMGAANHVRKFFNFVVAKNTALSDMIISILSNRSSRKFVVNVFHNVDVTMGIATNNRTIATQ